jgi:hypothetical protein
MEANRPENCVCQSNWNWDARLQQWYLAQACPVHSMNHRDHSQEELSMLPFVSCLCPTYGRYPEYGHLLEEAVESFARQDYPLERRELIILNDCPSQELICFTPGVRVVNSGFRYPTLGDKYNALCRLAHGTVLTCWEDDDISLPWRLTVGVRKLQESGANAFNPKAYWFLCVNVLQHEQMTGYAHNCTLYTREAWAMAGGYPPVSGPQDAAMDGRLRANCRVADGPLSMEESGYIYRWGVSNIHLSAHSPNTDDAYRQHGKRPVEKGRFLVKSWWRQDYAALVQEAIRQGGKLPIPLVADQRSLAVDGTG